MCYGDDEWEWNAVDVICVMAVLAGMIVTLWLCCDWAQTSMIWFLCDPKHENRSSPRPETSAVEKDAATDQAKLKSPERRVDSMHSQDGDDNDQVKGQEVGVKVDFLHSHPTRDGLLAMPVFAGNGPRSNLPPFEESERSLRLLGWLS